MSKKKKHKLFLGHYLTYRDVVALASISVSVFAGSYKKIKFEADLWDSVEAKFGLRRGPDESFIAAIHRVRKAIRTDRRAAPKAPVQRGPSRFVKDDFYYSWEWRTLRMEVLKANGRRCQCCGATPSDTALDGKKVRLVVDHIKPLSKFWSLRLERSNLQVLCDECNQGKGAWDETDWRETPPDTLTAEYRAIMGAPEALQ